MRDIALYYPYIHVRDDAWLKAAALYWPRIARLAPTGYPKHDSETARRLSGELDFILNIQPRRYSGWVADEFLEFIRKNRVTLQSRYSLPNTVELKDPYEEVEAQIAASMRRGSADLHPAGVSISIRDISQHPQPPNPYDGNRNIGWIHIEKLTDHLVQELIRTGLGVPAYPDWVIVAPGLAAVYTAALAERVASSNDLAVVTDSPSAYGILNGWDIETLARVLLEDDDQSEPGLDADEVGALYATLAVRTVVPAKIDDIPVDKIIKARRKLAAEFDAFRDHLNALADRLADLGRIKDASVLQARLDLMIDRDLRRPIDKLDRTLRRLDLEPAQAIFGLKSLELPAAAAAAASVVALPPGIGEAGLVAARLVRSGIETRARRRQALESSPAGYLLGLHKLLTPDGVVERLLRAIRRAGEDARRSTGQ